MAYIERREEDKEQREGSHKAELCVLLHFCFSLCFIFIYWGRGRLSEREGEGWEFWWICWVLSRYIYWCRRKRRDWVSEYVGLESFSICLKYEVIRHILLYKYNEMFFHLYNNKCRSARILSTLKIYRVFRLLISLSLWWRFHVLMYFDEFDA